MIHKSYYWKTELYKSFLTIVNFRHLERITEQSNVKLEKAIMMGAYIIRKLDEAQKIPPDFLKKKELLVFSISKGTIVDHLNWHRIDKHYDFENLNKAEKEWRFIINQIIHSFSFFFSFDNSGKLDGFLINSDKTKRDALFFLPLNILLKIFLTVSEVDITSANSHRELIGKESDGKPKYGEMKLTSADYSYPDKFDIDKIILDSMNGNIYKRMKDK